MINLPVELIQYVQGQYVAQKYTEGMYVFPALDDDVVEIVIDGFLKWAENEGYLIDDKLDSSFFSYKSEE